jgi:hypothetical protein
LIHQKLARGFFTETGDTSRNRSGEYAMPRPRKTEAEKRQKWPVLNVTPAERQAITEHAAASGLKTSAYLITRALQKPVSPRQDWQRIVRQQSRLSTQLAEIAALLTTSKPVPDAGLALLALRRIEHSLEERWFTGRDEDAC